MPEIPSIPNKSRLNPNQAGTNLHPGQISKSPELKAHSMHAMQRANGSAVVGESAALKKMQHYPMHVGNSSLAVSSLEVNSQDLQDQEGLAKYIQQTREIFNEMLHLLTMSSTSFEEKESIIQYLEKKALTGNSVEVDEAIKTIDQTVQKNLLSVSNKQELNKISTAIKTIQSFENEQLEIAKRGRMEYKSKKPEPKAVEEAHRYLLYKLRSISSLS